MKTYFLQTYGCTLNQADSLMADSVLAKAGWKKTRDEKAASVVVLNSCGVKSSTSNKILERVKRCTKPVVLMGCLSSDGSAVSHANPKAVLVGTSAISCLPQALDAALQNRRVSFFSREDKGGLLGQFSASTPGARSRSRAGATANRVIFPVPIAEGCASACSFCFTRIARGKLYSYPPKTIVRAIERAVASGAKEIQLTAQDTGVYGMDLGQSINLVFLLSQISSIPGNFRVRLGMINPEHAKKILPELLRELSGKRFYHFLHVPVQAGSDRVLKDMKRGHSAKDFEQVAAAFRKSFPDGVLATDIIVGFPGETEADFQQTLALLSRVRPDVVNVSKFTPRPFTPAAKMVQLPNGEIKRRSAECAELVRKIARENNARFIGRTLSVTITEKQKTLTGRDENYRQVALPAGKRAKIGDRVRAQISSATVSCLLSH